MKKTKDKKKGKHQQHGGHAPAPAKTGQVSSNLRWIILLVCLVFSSGAAYFVLTTYVWPPVPESVAGTWEVKGGEMNGTRMTFHRDGTFTSMVTIDGRNLPIEARVAFRNNTLHFTVMNGLTGREESKTQTVRSLTETEMIVEEGGAASKLVRVR